MAKRKQPRTEIVALEERFEGIFKLKEGSPARECARTAIRAAFDAEVFTRAVHCVNLAKISLGDRGERMQEQGDPEDALACLASAAVQLEHIMRAIASELDAIEQRRAA